jgi:signal transduction histidine kinase
MTSFTPRSFSLITLSITIGYIIVGIIAYYFVELESYFQTLLVSKEKKIASQLFAAGLSHELNNPLFIAKMTVERCLKQNKINQKDITYIKRALSRMDNVIENLEKIEQNKTVSKEVTYANNTKMLDI